LGRAFWESYVGPDALNSILSDSESSTAPGVQVDATLVFARFEGCSELSEGIPAATAIRDMEGYFDEVAFLAFACGGTVLSAGGESLLMVFGWPLRCSDHADRGMVAARAVAECLAEVNERRDSSGLPMIGVTLGVHSGSVVAGRIGKASGERLVVIGDAVDIATKVQSLNRELGTRVLITADTFTQIRSSMRLGLSTTAHIQGLSKPIEVYEVLQRHKQRRDPNGRWVPEFLSQERRIQGHALRESFAEAPSQA
jgi:adenylate cyclase